ncbi:MAG: type VI secretion system tip protein TssI/VgrG [Myxococcota bacterium]
MSQGERIEDVSYQFSTVDGPDIDWRVRRLHWVEGLSHAYEIRINLSTEDPEPDVDGMLGASAELLLDRGEEPRRTAYGVVQSVEYIGYIEDHLWVSLVIVPAFRLLSQRIDTRIFQGKTVVEVLKEVLEADLGDFDREVDVEGLAATYNPRDYCVQFRESTFAFCSRLMEEEGITYYFQSDDGTRHEKLVLADANDQYEDVELLIDQDIPIVAGNPEEIDRESIQRFDWEQKRVTNKVISWGFNFKIPSSPDEGEAAIDDVVNPRIRELYMFDNRRQIVDDPNDDPQAESFQGDALDQRPPMATKRLELSLVGSKTARGGSNAACFIPGRFFTLGVHQREDLDGQRFLITRIIHRSAGTGDTGVALSYSNSFECIPEAHVHRPAMLTPRPRVYGAQTATVVGPAGEEIHTDPHGRIKVKFHWDRLNPADDTASCWTRVAQLWAGPNWGGMVIPRIGMEVVVDFLDGNPDRPLVVGCVYNGDNAPPYPLPDDKTKSTFKTNSSPGGGGYNELRFEDAAGAEEIFTHAQKDYNEVVENDHNTTVHSCQTNTVDVNQTQSIGNNQTETVTGEQKMTVKKNRTVTIDGSQAVTINGGEANSGNSGSKLEITGDYKVDVSNTIEIQAPTFIQLTCGGSVIKMEPGKISLTAGDAATVVLDANALVKSSHGSQVLLDANSLNEASSGGKVLLDGNALVQCKAGNKMLLDGNALMNSTGNSQIVLDGSATMKGTSAATVSAPTATLAGAGGSVEAAAAGVTAAGGKVDVSGGMVNISGGMVKIN